jgi:DNA-binding CsgD family transcriptional regulator
MDKLSNAEKRVIAAIKEGASSHAEIADQLGIAPKTAQIHTGRIRGKLGLRRFIDLAVAIAIQDSEDDE